MRVLVVGSLPPPDCARAKGLRHEVARMVAEGHTVELVAPNPVATAHRYLTPPGIPGCVLLATMVRGYDSVVVQLEPGLPVRARAGRLERALSLLALSFALRRAGDVVIRLECLDDLPGGPGGRAASEVWRKAARIEVAGEDVLAAFAKAVGTSTAARAVSDSRSHEVDPDEGGWGEGADASAENVLGLVRVRAARERRELADSGTAHVAGWERLPAPGVTRIEFGSGLLPPEPSRGLGGLARSALAAADRRRLLRPAASAARTARRSASAVLRPERSA